MENFNIKLLTLEQKETRRRILEISLKRQFSHLGSCLSSVDLIDAVYKVKEKNDEFVLSNGHAGVALYVILEKYGFIKEPKITEGLNVHPDRNLKLGIFASTGSLGQGLPIALGMALSDRNKKVYCMISDGECTEGSIWEALRIASDRTIGNLKIILNANGWGAYNPIALSPLLKKIQAFGCETIEINGHDMEEIAKALTIWLPKKPVLLFAKATVEQFSFLKGQDAHYHIVNEKDYGNALGELR